MNKTNTIKEKVEATLTAVDTIVPIEVSPFFKENLMHHIRNVPAKKPSTTWIWLTPKLQLTMLIIFVCLNVYTYFSLDTDSSANTSNIKNFAITSGLIDGEDSQLFN